MQWAKLVSELIQEHQPERILDLKARKWYFSILAASYGAKVDVLDDIDNAEYPDYLKDHPNITYYKGKVEDFVFKEKYDFIVAKHIVMYYSKEYILDKLMTDMYNHLKMPRLTPHAMVLPINAPPTSLRPTAPRNIWRNTSGTIL